MMIVYYAMFEMNEKKIKYITVGFYSMSLLSSVSHLLKNI